MMLKCVVVIAGLNNGGWIVKLKRNSRTILKKYEGETYHFKHGFAKVPGCTFGGKPMKISLIEFKELAT